MLVFVNAHCEKILFVILDKRIKNSFFDFKIWHKYRNQAFRKA